MDTNACGLYRKISWQLGLGAGYWTGLAERGWALFSCLLERSPHRTTAQELFSPTCLPCNLGWHCKALRAHTNSSLVPKWNGKGKSGRRAGKAQRETWQQGSCGKRTVWWYISNCTILAATHNHTCKSNASMQFSVGGYKREGIRTTQSVMSPLDTFYRDIFRARLCYRTEGFFLRRPFKDSYSSFDTCFLFRCCRMRQSVIYCSGINRQAEIVDTLLEVKSGCSADLEIFK